MFQRRAYTEKYNTNNVYDERTTQQCSSGYCICAIGYVEKKDGIGYELPAAYGVDCSDKNCANSTQIFDSKSNKCVCSKKILKMNVKKNLLLILHLFLKFL